jgi:hypothetical protein
MTAAEVIALAFTRNLDVNHIKESDIDIAKQRYVDPYISGYTVDNAWYVDFCYPVIAYGVATDIFHRIASEVTDKGITVFDTTGARSLSGEQLQTVKNEYATQRNQLIARMTTAAETEAGIEVLQSGTVQVLYSNEPLKVDEL